MVMFIRTPMNGGQRVRKMPFIEQEAFVNLLRAHERVLAELHTTLRGAGLSEPQYNVLRILRGASPDGLPCSAISNRMITRQPDVTRILDRLQSACLIRRTRNTKDRRVVTVRIDKKGMDILAALDSPVRELHERQFGQFTRKELAALNRQLMRIAQSTDDGS